MTNNKKSINQATEDLTLALMYLQSFPNRDGFPFLLAFWQDFNYGIVDQLYEKGMIYGHRNKKRRSKMAYLTNKGIERARALLEDMGIEDKPLYEKFEFRTIKPEEADEAVDIERTCFSPAQACSREHMYERIAAAPDFFLVAIDRTNGKMAGFFNGLATNEYRLRDEFFTEASLHDPNGKNIILAGLAVLPQYRHMGLARELVYHYCRIQQARGTLRMVLTCVDEKVKMYEKFGFYDLGESLSNWGGQKWHEMRLDLNWGYDDEMD